MKGFYVEGGWMKIGGRGERPGMFRGRDVLGGVGGVDVGEREEGMKAKGALGRREPFFEEVSRGTNFLGFQ